MFGSNVFGNALFAGGLSSARRWVDICQPIAGWAVTAESSDAWADESVDASSWNKQAEDSLPSNKC